MNMNKNNFSEIEARLKEEATLRLNYSENQIYSKFKSKITIKLASICIRMYHKQRLNLFLLFNHSSYYRMIVFRLVHLFLVI